MDTSKNSSIVIQLDYSGTKCLFIGDAESEIEKDVLVAFFLDILSGDRR